MNGGIQIKQVTYFSITHLTGANSLAKRVKEIEDSGKMIDEINIGEYQAYCSTVIILCAAFLEAYINEFYSDCAERPTAIKNLQPSLRALYGRLWNNKVPRTSKYAILEKYELALSIAGIEPFDKGIHPYQEVNLLIQLRNSFIHYEPDDVLAFTSMPTSKEEIHNLEKKLKGHFPESTLWLHGNAYYPDRMLGLGCCTWAINNTIKFFKLFNQKMNLDTFKIDHLSI